MKKGQSNEEKGEMWKWIKSFQKAYKNSLCLYPGCTQKHGADCHSISKSKHLSAIAENGHVQWTRIGIDRIITGKAEPFLEGIGNVSIFRGLCNAHDGSIFQEVDNKDFIASEEQMFLLTYRTYLAQLWFNITDHHAATKNLTDKQLEEQEPIKEIPQYVSNRKEELEFHLWSMSIWKDSLDQMMLSKDYSDLRAYVIEFENRPTILTAIPFYRPFTIEGEYFHVPIHEHPQRPFIYVNILPRSTKGGYALFTWHQKSNKYSTQFIDSLNRQENDRITDILIKIFFVYYGNLVIDPVWWKQLDSKLLDYLKGLLAIGMLGQLELGWKSINDEVCIGDWKIVSKGYIK